MQHQGIERMEDGRTRGSTLVLRWARAWGPVWLLALGTSCGDDGSPTAAATESSTGQGSASGDSGADGTGDPNDPCGNGVVDGFEACDDGNRINGDGCNNDCTPSGQVRWMATFDGGAGVDCVEGVAADSQGEVIAAGFVSTAGAGEDLWLRKYDLEGNEVWTVSTDEAFGDDRWRAVAVGVDDSIYAAGFVTADLPSEGRNMLVRKLDPAGNELWSRTHNSPYSSSADQAYGVVATADGGVVVVGEEVVAQQDSDVWVRKYDGDGNEQWTVTHAGQAAALDSGRGVAELPGGDLVVSGWETQADGGRAIWVRRLSATGSEVWTQTFNAGAPNGNIGNGVAARSDDAVVATGSQRIGSGDTDLWVAGYGSDGTELFTQVFAGPGAGADVGRGVAVDDDAALVVGTVVSEGSVPKARVTRLTAAGVVLGSTDYGGVHVPGAEAYAVAIAPDHDVVFAGCELDAGDGDIMVVRVGP